MIHARVDQLRVQLRGAVLLEGDPDYDSARRVWNGMIDRRPLMIVRCTGLQDVMFAVRFARECNLPVCVRSGGHGVAGKAVIEGAVMIDLSLMKNSEINPSCPSAVAQAGLTWGEFDARTQEFELVTTGGVISSTGIAGLTLGGGIGWLMGTYGLSCDNLISVDLVNAEGDHVHASSVENDDLFWAVRGGNGNFGIVTAFEYQLHRHGPVLGGIILYPRKHATDLLRHYRDLTSAAPDELTVYAALMQGEGMPLVGLALCHSSTNVECAERDLARLRSCRAPLADQVSWRPYTQIQSMLDFTAPKGLGYFFKCPFIKQLTDDAIAIIVNHADSAPTSQTQVILEHMHGVASRIPADATAFALRRDHYSLNIIAAWDDPALTESCIRWARMFAAAIEPFGTGDAYVNYLGDEGPLAVRAAYGSNYERLTHLKAKYDPSNFFRFNQNILPATSSTHEW